MLSSTFWRLLKGSEISETLSVLHLYLRLHLIYLASEIQFRSGRRWRFPCPLAAFRLPLILRRSPAATYRATPHPNNECLWWRLLETIAIATNGVTYAGGSCWDSPAVIYPIRGTINERPDQDDNEFYSVAISGNPYCSNDSFEIETQTILVYIFNKTFLILLQTISKCF